jgi:zinc/manganese transport system permease protein
MFSGFMTNAWLAGTVVAVVAGVVGLFVVLRGGAFAAHAIPNGAFAGAAAAYWLGTNELLGLGICAGASALAIGSLGQRNRRDVATALVLVLLLASGALFLSLSGGYEPEVYGLLFGEILGVSSTQLLPVTLVGLGCLVVVALAWRPLLLSTVLPDVAEARGVRLRVTEIAFLLVVAAATTVTLPVVGALLIFSLMIGPPAAARSLTRRAGHALVLSVVLALLTAWLAIASSYWTNWPVGFFVGSYAAACYAAGRLGAALAGRRRRPGLSPRTAASSPPPGAGDALRPRPAFPR